MGVRHFVNRAECHQRDRVGMHDSPQLRPGAINRLVEGEFRGRGMKSFHFAVFTDQNHDIPPQSALVDSRRGNPDVCRYPRESRGCRRKLSSCGIRKSAPWSPEFITRVHERSKCAHWGLASKAIIAGGRQKAQRPAQARVKTSVAMRVDSVRNVRRQQTFLHSRVEITS